MSRESVLVMGGLTLAVVLATAIQVSKREVDVRLPSDLVSISNDHRATVAYLAGMNSVAREINVDRVEKERILELIREKRLLCSVLVERYNFNARGRHPSTLDVESCK